MKTPLLALLFAVLPVLGARADVVAGTYLGTSKTTVKYLDPDTLQPLASEVFTRNEKVIVGPLKSAGGFTESNPFSLTISPTTPGPTPTTGDVKAASARIFPINGANVLVQYWLLQNTATGFTGQLVVNHFEDDLARDKVVANLGGPGGTPAGFKMHDPRIGALLQTTLTSTVSGRQMTLKVTGYAFVLGQAVIHFTTKITARR